MLINMLTFQITIKILLVSSTSKENLNEYSNLILGNFYLQMKQQTVIMSFNHAIFYSQKSQTEYPIGKRHPGSHVRVGQEKRKRGQ